MISLKEVYLLVSKSLPPTLPSHLSVFHPPFLSLLFLEDPSFRKSTHLIHSLLTSPQMVKGAFGVANGVACPWFCLQDGLLAARRRM